MWSRPVKKISRQKYATVLSALRAGGVALLPSDSSYGLFTPIGSKQGIKRILKLKQRKDSKFTVVAHSLRQVQKLFPSSHTAQFTRTAQNVWPGPVSVVVNSRLSVRVPQVKLLRDLARDVGQPLIATSANQSGQVSTFSVAQARRQINLSQVDAVLDAGTLPQREPSAVVQFTSRGLKVHRVGPKRAQRLLKPFL